MVLDFWAFAFRARRNLDIFAEEVKPRATPLAVCTRSKTMTYGSCSLMSKLGGDAKGVIESGETINRCCVW